MLEKNSQYNSILFSIIIPTFNSAYFVEKCIMSILNQKNYSCTFEVIVVDDCSADNTMEVLNNLCLLKPELIKIINLEKNSGPGIARNAGLELAVGNWILFLDSDDSLADNALEVFTGCICDYRYQGIDSIGFNWKFCSSSVGVERFIEGRNDTLSLAKKRNGLIEDYLSLKMDGSVIYTLVRNRLIQDNKLCFRRGFHEDVDFIFKVYWYSRKTIYLDCKLYFKNNRVNSIINQCTYRHIDGFFNAYNEIFSIINNSKMDNSSKNSYLKAWHNGLIGVVATRLREISLLNISYNDTFKLYKRIFDRWLEISNEDLFVKSPIFKTKYYLLAETFFNIMSNDIDELVKNNRISDFINDNIRKSWGCKDLLSSAFLAPREIRTCCKRFFVEGKMKGDVRLLSLDNDGIEFFTSEGIFNAKKKILSKINKGEHHECYGCPFLEFKAWEDNGYFDLKYISFEYHTICNMRCVYCSDKYYGGEKPGYNVKALVLELINNKSLDNCESIVWGGGEPLLSDSFIDLLSLTVSKFPNIENRILTNCIQYSDVLYSYINTSRINIVTSIDAGMPETFYKIRKSNKLYNILEHLKRYSLLNPSKVTIKYIFLDDLNSGMNEIIEFTKLIKQYNLENCNFQISYDFRDEHVCLDVMKSVIILYALLIKAGCRLIFLDDLVRARLMWKFTEIEVEVYAKLAEIDAVDTFADRKKQNEVIIWGAGWQAKQLLEKSFFFKDVKVKCFVDDSDPRKIGTKYLGYSIMNTDYLKNNKLPIVIAAVQGYSKIYDSFVRLGINENRLIKGLII